MDRRSKTFNEGGLVYGSFVQGTIFNSRVYKLAQKKIDLFCVLCKISDNAYVFDLLDSYVISRNFNIQDLYD